MCVDGEGNDISDSTKCVGLRLFTCFYILFGCGYVFAQLANVFGGVLVAFSDLIKRLPMGASSTIRHDSRRGRYVG